MSVEDAMVWCQSDVSRGVLHGTRWAYFWTRSTRFIEEYGGKERVLDITGYIDDGSWDERIEVLGLTKIGFERFREVFEPLGVTVKMNKEER